MTVIDTLSSTPCNFCGDKASVLFAGLGWCSRDALALAGIPEHFAMVSDRYAAEGLRSRAYAAVALAHSPFAWPTRDTAKAAGASYLRSMIVDDPAFRA